jgi:hypothetical protein
MYWTPTKATAAHIKKNIQQNSKMAPTKMTQTQILLFFKSRKENTQTHCHLKHSCLTLTIICGMTEMHTQTHARSHSRALCTGHHSETRSPSEFAIRTPQYGDYTLHGLPADRYYVAQTSGGTIGSGGEGRIESGWGVSEGVGTMRSDRVRECGGGGVRESVEEGE